MDYQTITTSNLDYFYEHFYKCCDSVIRNINITYDRNAHITLTIEVQDSTIKINNQTGWSMISVKLTDVVNMRLLEGNASYHVISDGLFFKKVEGDLWGIGFLYPAEDAKTLKDFTRLPSYFICKNIEWVKLRTL